MTNKESCNYTFCLHRLWREPWQQQQQQQQQQQPRNILQIYPRTPTQPSDRTTTHENNHVQLINVQTNRPHSKH